jgi:Domain of unknown function (DUF4340)
VDGDNVYARLADEPFVVAVRRGLLDQIPIDPLQWQELSIFKFKPEQILRLHVSTDKELALERDDNNQWRWLKGSGQINQTNLQSLLNTLSSLRAVRWAGPTVAQQGFDKPQLAITFTTSPDDKVSHKLLIGSAAGNGTCFARTEEREGTFIVRDSDLNALKLPLTTASSPSPSPAPKQIASPAAKP